MRIAIFDYKIVATNPIGSCHLRLLRDLSREHQFTVFAAAFENPAPERIEWVRVPTPMRPLALLFVVFHVMAPLVYVCYRLRRRVRFHLVQMVESNLGFGDISYSHFCHTAYLKEHWAATPGHGARRILRWLDHWLHAVLESHTYRHAKKIVVPSRGLGNELTREFPFTAGKVGVLPNAVDVDRLEMPVEFERTSFRAELGFASDDIVFAFAALGQFERKGLPLLLEAVSQLHAPRAKVLVIGGESDLISAYRSRIRQLGLEQQVVFAGMQQDVRPFLWAADAFAFPSAYETFSLVTYEAAAAGLPVIAPRLNGIEDLVRDGDNGIVIARSVDGVVEGLRRFLELPGALRNQMSKRAKASSAQYNQASFSERWRLFYQALDAARQLHLKRRYMGHHRIKSLDGLRAISIFIVLAAHVAETANLRHEPYTRFVSNVGSFGVKIFFVISGFLITTLLLAEERRNGRISLGMFYLRRAFRILPVAYLFTGVVAALMVMGRIVLPQHNLLYAVTFAMNMAPEGTWWTGHLWSLAVEEQFYLVWPLVFLLTGMRMRIWACVAMAVLAPALRISTLLYAPQVFDFMHQSLLFLGDSLAVGCLLALMAGHLERSQAARQIMVSKAFAMVPILAVLMYGTLNSRLWPKFHFALGDSISLVCIAATIWRVIHVDDAASRLLNTRILVVVGTLSYSLYIWQQLFLNAGSTRWINAFPQNLVFALLTAAASYYLIENPVLRLRTRVVNLIREGRHSGEPVPQPALESATVQKEMANQVSA